MELQLPLERNILATILFGLKRKLLLSNELLSKIPLARKIPLYGNIALLRVNFSISAKNHRLHLEEKLAKCRPFPL